jgi:translocation and assembly module TamA
LSPDPATVPQYSASSRGFALPTGGIVTGQDPSRSTNSTIRHFNLNGIRLSSETAASPRDHLRPPEEELPAQRRLPSICLAALLCGAFVQTLAAQEVELILPDTAADLRPTLTAAALTLAIDENEAQAPQDYVAAARADYRRILTGLYAEGHYGGTISILIDGREAAGIQPLDAPARIDRVTITVDPGPRFSFGQAAVGPVPPGTELPDDFAPDAPARSDTIRTATAAAVSAWRDVGHAKAAAGDQSIIARHDEARLDAVVQIAPGPRLSFGQLSVVGNERTRSDRIAYLAGLKPGRIFSPDDVDRAAMRLRRTGTFRSVTVIEAEDYLPDLTLPMTVQVVEMPLRRLGFGAELSSTEGVALNAFWLHRNLLGGMERFRIEGSVTGIEAAAIGDDGGGPDYRIALNFGRPGTFNPDIDLLADIVLQHLDEPDYSLDQLSATLGFTQYVREDLEYQAGIGFLTARERTNFRERDYTLLTLPIEATLDRRDDAFDARSGYFINIEATPFLGLVGGDDGVRVLADARYYQSFGERVTLAGRGQFGTVQGADIFDAPADFLFYSGGGGTVRGQPYKSLGIDIARIGLPGMTGGRIGGASFVGAQLEARIGVTERIGAVGFYDIGMIDDASLPSDTAKWHAGAGLGLRYDTPIGPIRLDLATPASGPSAGERLEVYIGIGQAF